MLSFILRITTDYESEHGHSPNTLVLSKQHMARLNLEYLDVNLDSLLEQLGMDILVVEESGHPRVGWFERQRRRAVN